MCPDGKLSPAVTAQVGGARSPRSRGPRTTSAERAPAATSCDACRGRRRRRHRAPVLGREARARCSRSTARADFDAAAAIASRASTPTRAPAIRSDCTRAPTSARCSSALDLAGCRVIVNQAHCFATGGSFDNGLPFSLSMGCGTWGRNSFSDNLNYRHFLNITRVVASDRPERVPRADRGRAVRRYRAAGYGLAWTRTLDRRPRCACIGERDGPHGSRDQRRAACSAAARRSGLAPEPGAASRYGELRARRAARSARELAAHGVRPGDVGLVHAAQRLAGRAHLARRDVRAAIVVQPGEPAGAAVAARATSLDALRCTRDRVSRRVRGTALRALADALGRRVDADRASTDPDAPATRSRRMHSDRAGAGRTEAPSRCSCTPPARPACRRACC